ncbi:hypothetical protein Mal35_18660 [Gimesia maris]|uniref:hypothetical protein n=1 Tax=Gimesia maris TaxID=122 RepID=UPI00118AA901|nr:hypothetical protein [Gimesia maris]QDT78417.1 hypothetical protein Mal35_18660 [Gimesia maris]
MPAKVFVSVGSPADVTQKKFREAIISAIETTGLTPRVMSNRDWDYKNPLRGLRRAMSDCSGAIVIAYARYEFPNGIEKRTPRSKPLRETAFPTSWNQIEAAMAYEKGLPLLVVAQTGLRPDAMFENSGDIRPYWTDLDPEVCHSDGFLGYLNSWKEDVIATANHQYKQEVSASQKVTVRTLFTSLPWNEGLAVISTIIGIVIAALSVGYRVGSGEWPF